MTADVLSRCTQDARGTRLKHVELSMGKRQFGNVRRLPSKRWQAFYGYGTDERHYSPFGTFDTKLDAEAWLADERRLSPQGAGPPPD